MPFSLMMEAVTCYLPNKPHGLASQKIQDIDMATMQQERPTKILFADPNRVWIDSRGTERVGIALKHENFIRKVPGSNLGRGMIIVTQASQRVHEQIDL